MQEEYIVRIVLAALAGGVVGIERAYHDKSAGFRTMVLIATGSAFFTIMSYVMGSPDSDSSRIAAAIVSGVGFLGAGIIIKVGINIRGLTTAASIWLVASIGMGMGLGLFTLSWTITGIALFVLWILPPLERAIDNLHEFSFLEIVVKNTDKQEEKILDLFREHNVQVVHMSRAKENSTERILTITIKTTPQRRETIGRSLANNKAVMRFTA